MSGLEVAAGVAGLIALSVTLFNGCVRGIALISAARHTEDDVSRIASILDYEEYRLLQWGNRVGFFPGGVRNQRINWEICKEILKQLHELLTDASVLKRHYNLEYVEEFANSSATVSTEATGGRKGIGRLWSHASPNLKRSRAEIIQGRTSPLKKLRWLTLDQGKIRRVLADIAQFINYLYGLLERSDQDFIRTSIAALLRDLISRSTESSDVDLIKVLLDEAAVTDSAAIEAAATVKQTRLLLRVDTREDESSQNPQGQVVNNFSATFPTPIRPRQTLSRLSYLHLIRGTTGIGEGKEIAIYRISSSNKNVNARVLLEWKKIDKRDDAKLERRIQELTLLLCNLSDKSFHSLKCLGYLKHKLDGDFHNYAYVYELVDMNGDERPDAVPKFLSISHLLQESRKPSLTQRINICFALAESILQLHTAGWLHKNLCAENVLFIDREPLAWSNGSSLGPYLSGYEFTRFSLEVTEKMPSDPWLDLYRHPSAQPNSSHSFRKAFDLYALGCVLLVVIIWESLGEILSGAHAKLEETMVLPTASSEDARSHRRWTTILKGKEYLSDKNMIKGILDRVAFSAGDSARKAVEICFFPGQGILKDDNDDEEDILETSVNEQISIVALLKSLEAI